ncbi:MAG: glycoside hydrolase family 3 N-terminal domain-containing protein [Bacteroidia bacterium]
MKAILSTLTLCALILAFSSCQPKWNETAKEGFNVVTNPGGSTLGYAPSSGVTLLTVDRLAFKDLNKNGQLDPYEDWRLPVDERAKDLASKMSVEQIAGLMLYSRHQSLPTGSQGFMAGTYGGKSFEESGAKASDLSDQQIRFLTDDNLRHVLLTRVESPAVAAQWNNNAQALVEGLGLGIPANNSSDPRHGASSEFEYNAGAGGDISLWPNSLGMAATFDPELVRKFGEIASREYRALGIATALSPQIDLATEPRWNRFSGSFGENPGLATDMARAYTDGFQNSDNGGWGFQSVNAMVKHWPGGGPEEGGRDGHFGYGKFAVYPGNNLADHLKPFTEGAFKLEGGTGMASAVMPYYTISWNQDQNGENVGNAYSKYLITTLLREKYGYDGVVCTDWLVTGNPGKPHEFQGKSWGMETASIAERHYKVILAGGDQYGGNNEAGPVIEAYQMGVAEFGEEWIRERFEKSAMRLLRNIFNTGLFENPYLDVEESSKLVGNADFMQAGYEAQLKSIVMVKNSKNTLPLSKDITVYVPQRMKVSRGGFFGPPAPPALGDPISPGLVSRYFKTTTNPAEADVAMVFIETPITGPGYDVADLQKGGNGYVPISLQYRPYTAAFAREESIAGGDPAEDFTNRTYKGKTVNAANETDLDLVLNTKKVMGDKPVIVILDAYGPTIMSEFEGAADAILVTFDVQNQAVMDIVSGAVEPSGLLPCQMPANMKTVEMQFEDVPQDMEVTTDSDGNAYNFGFGMNWAGVIQDGRTAKYAGK